jgi:hypothetical protein
MMSLAEFVGHVHKTVAPRDDIPLPSADNRGVFVVADNGSGFADNMLVCRKRADGGFEWFDLANLVPTTPTFDTVTIGQYGYIKFPNGAMSSDPNDGKIGSELFDSGLNIVGIDSDGYGRKVAIWGMLVTMYSEVWAMGGYKSADGSVGVTADYGVMSDVSTPYHIQIKNGLITGYYAP